MAIGRVNTGGGGSGGTLTVTGIAGHTVTATKDGKTYTRTFNSSGVAVFKGLSTGTWTLTMTGDGQTATRTVDVNADYAITITYFSATINITYPATSTCVVTNSGGQTVASDTNTGSSTKTWTATVGATGTYTVTATATDGSGNSKSQSVSITADGQSESVELSYALVLFDKDAGINRTDLTGGFELYDGYVGFSYSGNATGGYGIMSGSKVADIANYSTLVVETGDITAPQGAYLGIASEPAAAPKHVYSKMTSKVSVDANGKYTLDISSITSSAYIALCCYNNGAGGINVVMRAKRIYLQ